MPLLLAALLAGPLIGAADAEVSNASGTAAMTLLGYVSSSPSNATSRSAQQLRRVLQQSTTVQATSEDPTVTVHERVRIAEACGMDVTAIAQRSAAGSECRVDVGVLGRSEELHYVLDVPTIASGGVSFRAVALQLVPQNVELCAFEPMAIVVHVYAKCAKKGPRSARTGRLSCQHCVCVCSNEAASKTACHRLHWRPESCSPASSCPVSSVSEPLHEGLQGDAQR